MNTLSWLIYIASVCDSASTFFGVLAFLGGVVAVIGLVMSLMWTDGTYKNERYIKAYENLSARGRELLPRGILLLVVFGGISVILPGKNTVYAIAASEVGERVIQSGAVKGIADDSAKALQAWIKKRIEPTK